jgi:hypothetical protein
MPIKLGRGADPEGGTSIQVRLRAGSVVCLVRELRHAEALRGMRYESWKGCRGEGDVEDERHETWVFGI